MLLKPVEIKLKSLKSDLNSMYSFWHAFDKYVLTLSKNRILKKQIVIALLQTNATDFMLLMPTWDGLQVSVVGRPEPSPPLVPTGTNKLLDGDWPV